MTGALAGNLGLYALVISAIVVLATAVGLLIAEIRADEQDQRDDYGVTWHGGTRDES